ncbi:MAG: ABC transporter ATP-binding protein [Propionibacteriaceae bacterium]|nr:ABC transporter ATP-binding protein [Propionibacteriaceae bacterium]
MTTTAHASRVHDLAHPADSTPTDAAITLSGVRRSYTTASRLGLSGRRVATESYEAVRGIDLTVRRGELFALLGTNGAGKTSTVELIEGLAKPSAGEIRVLGHDPVSERARVRHRTGVVLQNSGFPSTLTVDEMARMWHGTLTRPLPVDDMLAAVDLADRATVETSKLSGGERRRLDVALALMADPEVLLLDEPTTGLDPESRRTIWGLITALVERGSAVLLTTHYLEEAEQLADRIAIMHEGVIAREGTLADIVADAPSRITFTRPEGLDLGALEVPGARVDASGQPSTGTRLSGQRNNGTHAGQRAPGTVLIETPTLQDTLARVLAWAGDEPLGSLNARAASLEQVFLAIADQPLADDHA